MNRQRSDTIEFEFKAGERPEKFELFLLVIVSKEVDKTIISPNNEGVSSDCSETSVVRLLRARSLFIWDNQTLLNVKEMIHKKVSLFSRGQQLVLLRPNMIRKVNVTHWPRQALIIEF